MNFASKIDWSRWVGEPMTTLHINHWAKPKTKSVDVPTSIVEDYIKMVEDISVDMAKYEKLKMPLFNYITKALDISWVGFNTMDGIITLTIKEK